jgi:exopolysaccharide biosynthesis WecB/TagA/CpsF family protein
MVNIVEGGRRWYGDLPIVQAGKDDADDRVGAAVTRSLLGVDIIACAGDAAIKMLTLRLANRVKTKVAFANTNLLVQTRKLADGADLLKGFVVFNDGVGVDLGSWFKYGSLFPENLNGTDLAAKLMGGVPQETRVFLLGARPSVVSRAAAEIERRFSVTVCGFADGYAFDNEALVAQLNALAPDIVLVAMGNPKQEMWIRDNAGRLAAPLLIGVGAWFDFLTRERRRAPRLVRRARFEWMFRLIQEPRRLWRRYSIDALFFLLLVLDEKYGFRRERA